MSVFIVLGRKIGRHPQEIDASLEHGLSNAHIELGNTKIGVFTPLVYGVKSPEALFGLVMLSRRTPPRPSGPKHCRLTHTNDRRAKFKHPAILSQ
jgi:hypothetical protein